MSRPQGSRLLLRAHMLDTEAITIKIPVVDGLSDSTSVDSESGPADERVPERPCFVHALALEIDPAWRRLSGAERCRSALAFVEAVDDGGPVRTLTYSTIGVRRHADLLLWSLGPDLDRMEQRAAAALRSGLGAWTSVTQSLAGFVTGSPYARPTPAAEPALFAGARERYLVVYPFSKSADWYLMSREARQGIMNEHIRVGRRYPQVRQLLANAFGLGDQDYVVAYETADVAAFGALVHELRGTQGRRATVRDTPVLVAMHRPAASLAALLAA
jgi:chlorite dismutase